MHIERGDRDTSTGGDFGVDLGDTAFKGIADADEAVGNGFPVDVIGASSGLISGTFDSALSDQFGQRRRFFLF